MTPLCEGKGPENPGVEAPFAVAGCRGNRSRAVVRRLDKFDLRPCPLRLRSSMLVLGCTGLMRSTGFKRRTYSVTVQKTVEIPQIQLLDKLMTSVVVQRPVPGCDSADNCGGAAVAWGPCGDSTDTVLGQNLTRLLRMPAVVCSSTRWSMSLLCCAMGFRRCSQ